ncbi:MAG TPA: hypothetical protein DD624_03350 [Alphaproteobacteria bacterium]|nr:hypothetical protein [Alphaproteobacteria bacterium]
MAESFRYFKVGVVPVKVEYTQYGARAAYVWKNGAFKIDNSYIAEVARGEDVEELTKAAFEKLL